MFFQEMMCSCNSLHASARIDLDRFELTFLVHLFLSLAKWYQIVGGAGTGSFHGLWGGGNDGVEGYE